MKFVFDCFFRNGNKYAVEGERAISRKFPGCYYRKWMLLGCYSYKWMVQVANMHTCTARTVPMLNKSTAASVVRNGHFSGLGKCEDVQSSTAIFGYSTGSTMHIHAKPHARNLSPNSFLILVLSCTSLSTMTVLLCRCAIFFQWVSGTWVVAGVHEQRGPKWPGRVSAQDWYEVLWFS